MNRTLTENTTAWQKTADLAQFPQIKKPNLMHLISKHLLTNISSRFKRLFIAITRAGTMKIDDRRLSTRDPWLDIYHLPRDRW